MKTLTAPTRKASQPRILVAIPTTGSVRFEWAMQFAQLIVPVNWSQTMTVPRLMPYGPIGFHVAEARNNCVQAMLDKGFEWLFFLDHDTVPPPDLLIRLNQYVQTAKYPIVCGVYYAKGLPSYPLVFRGRGNGCFLDWKRGEKVWADGIPMGCTLIHRKVFEHLPKVKLTDGTRGEGWFDTPRFAGYDPETGNFHKEVGTEDLDFCDRVIKHKVLQKAGWPDIGRRKYPFLVDSKIWCQHLDGHGNSFPSSVPKIGVRIADTLDLDL